MSAENVKVVQTMWDAFLRGDLEAAFATVDPDIEWDGTNLPDGKVGRGHEAITEHLVKWLEQWDEWKVDLEEVIDAGDEKVVLIFREHGRSNSGLAVDELHAELYLVRGGKVVSRRGFSDPNEALEAAGLPKRGGGV